MQKDKIIKLLKQNYFSILGSKMEGLIHNLNSPLNNVIGYALLAKKKYPDFTEMEKILASSNTINAILKNLNQALERYKIQEKQLISLNELIDNELDVLKHSLFFKHKVEIQFSEDKALPKLWFVYSDIALLFYEIFETIRIILQEEKEKRVMISTFERDENLILLIEAIQSENSTEKADFKNKLNLTGEIIILLLSEYHGSFQFQEEKQKVIFEIIIPKGANQCLT